MSKLFMLMLGCKPVGRHTEQHDVLFGIGQTVKDLIPQINEFWPEAMVKIHVDAWREVTKVGDFGVRVEDRNADTVSTGDYKLFFINLGGYQKGLFDERHYKMLSVQRDMAGAVKEAKATEFFKNVHFEGAQSHIDDRYGLDVDDAHEIAEILSEKEKQQYILVIEPGENLSEDEIHLGYFKLNTLP